MVRIPFVTHGRRFASGGGPLPNDAPPPEIQPKIPDYEIDGCPWLGLWEKIR